MLRFVDHDHRMGVQRDQRRKKLLQLRHELVARRVAARRGGIASHARDDAEVAQHLMQQIVGAQQRIRDDREEDPSFVKPFQQCPAQHRLAGADLAGDDDDAFAAAERFGHFRAGARMRSAEELESQIGREAEGMPPEAVELLTRRQLVGRVGTAGRAHVRGHHSKSVNDRTSGSVAGPEV